MMGLMSDVLNALKCLEYSSPHESQEQVVARKHYAGIVREYITHSEPVVRCKDCKNRLGETFDGFGQCAENSNTYWNENDYCSFGERRKRGRVNETAMEKGNSNTD